MSVLASFLSNRLLSSVWKLLRLRIRLSVNEFRHAKTVKKTFIIIGYLALLGFAVGSSAS